MPPGAVDLGGGAHPFDVLVGVDEERPDRFRRGVDHDLRMSSAIMAPLVSWAGVSWAGVSLGGLGHVAQPFEAGRP